MTKIKDLVTSIVHQVYAFHPIDAERYELCARLNERLNAAFGRQMTLDLTKDEDLKCEADAIIDRVEDALFRYYQYNLGIALCRREVRELKLLTGVPEIAWTNLDFWEMSEDKVLEWRILTGITILSSVYKQIGPQLAPK